MDFAQNHDVSVDTLHRRMHDATWKRNVPSAPLQPYLNARPVMTKYSLLPIVDPRKAISVPMEQLPVYNPESVFNPGNARAPFSGYATNVALESELRNQCFALQRCSQAVYVPSSTSDLYDVRFRASAAGHDQLAQCHPFLNHPGYVSAPHRPSPPPTHANDSTNDPANDPALHPSLQTCDWGLFYNTTRCHVKQYTKGRNEHTARRTDGLPLRANNK